MDGKRLAEWNRRAALFREARKAATQQAQVMRRYAQIWRDAAKQLEESADKFDPALTNAKKSFQPDPLVMAKWLEEFNALDEAAKCYVYGGSVENFYTEKRNDFIEKRRWEFVRDDQKWEEFCRVGITDLQNKKRESEKRFECLDESMVISQIRSIFPDFKTLGFKST